MATAVEIADAASLTFFPANALCLPLCLPHASTGHGFLPRYRLQELVKGGNIVVRFLLAPSSRTCQGGPRMLITVLYLCGRLNAFARRVCVHYNGSKRQPLNDVGLQTAVARQVMLRTFAALDGKSES